MHRAKLLLLALAISSTCLGKEIGFEEDFALAADRAEALKLLIPGTDEYYYYNCLYLQHTNKFAEADALVKVWLRNRDRNDLIREIQNRQALLKYPQSPRESLDYIAREMGLHFNHQRRTDVRPSWPDELDQNRITREVFLKLALSGYPGTLAGFEPRALDWAASLGLDASRRRHLLSQLKRSDIANLPRLVADDLDAPHSGPFGSLPIHAAMLKSQLDELLKIKPSLLNETRFVQIYLTKLRPGADELWRTDPVQREAYLDRLWEFASRLAPVHNSLKAHVLHHRLVHDRSQGVFNKGRFETYIRIPRSIGYANKEWARTNEYRNVQADLNAGFQEFTLLDAIGNDEPVVKTCLMTIFATSDSIEPYKDWISDTYLKDVLAETKIVLGDGDQERWYSYLGPQKYKRLRDRIDLDFAPAGKTTFSANEDVRIEMFVKNVPTLIMKVYEINALRAYLQSPQQIGGQLNLDGLVANEETTFDYKDVSPFRRTLRQFDLPTLRKPGVYVVEFIGNGAASRVIIHKGRLRQVNRISSAGHIFNVMNEEGKIVPDAAIWMGGREYRAGEGGRIILPFSTRPCRQPIVIVGDGIVTLDEFNHVGETYSLDAGIYVDREQLLAGRTARLVLRPMLNIHGQAIALSLLEEPKLEVRAVDLQGISTTVSAGSIELKHQADTTYDFHVPSGLAGITFVLSGKVKNLSMARDDVVSDSQTFALNQIDGTDSIEQPLLGKDANGYFIELLGKTGEAAQARPVNLSFKHRYFVFPVHVTLQTNADGRIALGELREIESLTASGMQISRQWTLPEDSRSYCPVVHGVAGEEMWIPYLGSATRPDPLEFSLLEERDGVYVADHLEALSIEGGFLRIAPLGAGDYNLKIKSCDTEIALRVSAGPVSEGYVVGRGRMLELLDGAPMHISGLDCTEGVLRIRVTNANEFTRVHIIGSRYVADYSAAASFGSLPMPVPAYRPQTPLEAIHQVGRDIGEEYRYVLERKFAAKFPGVMLDRPSLLLNPWSIRKTQTATREAGAGEAYVPVPQATRPVLAEDRAAQNPMVSAPLSPSNLDFLGEGATVIANLVPDNDGMVLVKVADLGAHACIRVVAQDHRHTVVRNTVVESDRRMRFADLRLDRLALDPSGSFAQTRQVTVLPSGGRFVLDDLGGRYEVYDSLAKAYRLMTSLKQDETISEFAFVLDWPKLDVSKKRALYEKYASHELHFFLAHKDPEFFKSAVLPYLTNKKDKTFMDMYLLGEDVSAYAEPYRFAQLNFAERVLLGKALRRQEGMRAHIKDMYDLIAPDQDRLNRLFETALNIGRLDRASGVVSGFDFSVGLPELRAAPAAPASRGMMPRQLNAPMDGSMARKGLMKSEESERLSDKMFRADAVQLYLRLDKTEEWVESNYYRLPIEEHVASRVGVNAFWLDYANHQDGPFLSANLAQASTNATEMMLALAVLDLPFESPSAAVRTQGDALVVDVPGAAVVFHQRTQAAQPSADGDAPILVSQNFFRASDRHTHVNNERLDKYVTKEFLSGIVYGCQVVVTNPTSGPRKLDVLTQIPRGAMPVKGTRETNSVYMTLNAYSTATLEYYFYFPMKGLYAHYPVHVACMGADVASAKPFTFNVVDKLSELDTTSWDYVSQNGSDEDVLSFLRANNPHRLDLAMIAWRMKDEAFFARTIDLLRERNVYHNTLWSYSIKHNREPEIREFLKQSSDFVSACGAYIDSVLLTIDPVERRQYQHMEYSPLVNARAHVLGARRMILNDRLHGQYQRFMKILTYRPCLLEEDRLAVTYYMLLQDRIEEAMRFFDGIPGEHVCEQIQYNYVDAWLSMARGDLERAGRIAAKYAEHPSDRWRKRFAEITSQLDQQTATSPVDSGDRTQRHTAGASKEPAFDLVIDGRRLRLDYQNIAEVRVNYYPMDVELLFSRQPFAQQAGGQFALIKPRATQTLTLAADARSIDLSLPEEFTSSNVMVEVVAAGRSKALPCYANSLAVQVIESFGHLLVTRQDDGAGLAKVYVKAYARMTDGSVKFYKDGYTDHRGRFDYASLNTDEIETVERFALLILSEAHGTVVREAAPPKR